MKKQIIFWLFLLLSFTTFSQIKYEKGYFIKNNGEKINCFIKHLDWKNNPSKFSYKINENEPPKIITINEVKQFVIQNIVKYERQIVKIDVSSQNLQTLPYERAPEWKEKTIFLKLLVDGNYDLFVYRGRYIKDKYFFRNQNSEAEQLVYKIFLNKNEVKKENLTYLYQLNKYVNCNNLSEEELEVINYNESSLIKYFIKNNECENPIKSKEDKNIKRVPQLNLSIKPGFNYNSYTIQKYIGDDVFFNFKGKFSLRLGVEFEILLPFNNYKWSLFLEPNYRYYKSEASSNIFYGAPVEEIKETSYVDIQSFEIPFGVRYYFNMKKDNERMFLNAMFIIDNYFDSNVQFDHLEPFDSLNSYFNSAFGFGYIYKNKYSFESRIYSRRDPIIDNDGWMSKFSQFSLIFGYNFL